MQEKYSRKTEAADLQRAFTILDSKRDGKIDASELGQLFKRLGYKFTKVWNTWCNRRVSSCGIGDLSGGRQAYVTLG